MVCSTIKNNIIINMKKQIEDLNQIRSEISAMSINLKKIIGELNYIDYHLEQLNSKPLVVDVNINE